MGAPGGLGEIMAERAGGEKGEGQGPGRDECSESETRKCRNRNMPDYFVLSGNYPANGRGAAPELFRVWNTGGQGRRKFLGILKEVTHGSFWPGACMADQGNGPALPGAEKKWVPEEKIRVSPMDNRPGGVVGCGRIGDLWPSARRGRGPQAACRRGGDGTVAADAGESGGAPGPAPGGGGGRGGVVYLGDRCKRVSFRRFFCWRDAGYLLKLTICRVLEGFHLNF
jgi:hypothetical protein